MLRSVRLRMLTAEAGLDIGILKAQAEDGSGDKTSAYDAVTRMKFKSNTDIKILLRSDSGDSVVVADKGAGIQSMMNAQEASGDVYEGSELVLAQMKVANENRVSRIMFVFATTQIISIAFAILAPHLYKQHRIDNLLYFAIVMSAYALATITRMSFTYFRILDAEIKNANNLIIKQKGLEKEKQEVKVIAADSKWDTNNLSTEVSDNQVKKSVEGAPVVKQRYPDWSMASKCEFILIFCVHTTAGASEIVVIFLYGARKINLVGYSCAMGLIQCCFFALLVHSTYKRFLLLRKVQQDNKILSSETQTQPSEGSNKKDDKLSSTVQTRSSEVILGKEIQKDDSAEMDLSLIMSIIIIAQMISVSGKVCVPILYQRELINVSAYFLLSVVSIGCTSLVYFILDLNKAVDYVVTNDNREQLAVVDTNISVVQQLDNARDTKEVTTMAR